MHIAIIMDGNGRWAAQRRLPRSAGHRAGAKAVNLIVEAAARRGVETLSLYAFSAANWQRPKAEVSALFGLLRRYLLSQTQRCVEQSVRINVIGRRDRLSPTLVALIERSEAATAACNRMLLRLAIDYSAQHSLLETGRRLRGMPEVDPSTFREVLTAVDHSAVTAPEVDLLIRTGGERRLSDFLLWECAYAELLFLDTWWPDFDEPAFDAALLDFAGRDRRYGRIRPNPALSLHHG